LIAFKEGESSTVSALNVLGRENFTTLLNAFPTVSNFAIDLFSTIGFTSIYLIGVDLGFVDVKHHHSKSSGYYQENGEETYDFTKSANTSLVVPGNFRPRVNTKHEFKVSRQIIEQVTNAKPKGQEFYNCSDGAKINGTLPIRPNELLIVATELHKSQVIEKLNSTIFSSNGLVDYVENFENMFSKELLIKELSAFETLLENEINNKKDVENIINKQKEMLFSSYKSGKSLLFYYLYGTVNYANAVLIKLGQKLDSSDQQQRVQLCIETWQTKIKQISNKIKAPSQNDYDRSEFNARKREFIKLNQGTFTSESILLISDSEDFNLALSNVLNHKYTYSGQFDISHPQDIVEQEQYDHIVIFQDDKNTTSEFKVKNRGNISTTLLAFPPKNDGILDVPKDVTYCPILINHPDNILTHNLLALNALLIAWNRHQCPLILIKVLTRNPNVYGHDEITITAGYSNYLDFNNYILCFDENNKFDGVSNSGARGLQKNAPLIWQDLILKVLSQNEYDRHLAVFESKQIPRIF
jgi:hypothetical protein